MFRFLGSKYVVFRKRYTNFVLIVFFIIIYYILCANCIYLFILNDSSLYFVCVCVYVLGWDEGEAAGPVLWGVRLPQR